MNSGHAYYRYCHHWAEFTGHWFLYYSEARKRGFCDAQSYLKATGLQPRTATNGA